MLSETLRLRGSAASRSCTRPVPHLHDISRRVGEGSFLLSSPKVLRVRRNIGRGQSVQASASGDSEAGAGLAMTLDEACELLGVSANSTFDDILAAKNKQLSKNDGDAEKMMQIEAAYDMLLMDSMKRRLSGDVPSSVRFADVQRRKPATQQAQKLLQQLPGGVTVEKPPPKTLTSQSIVFGLLAAWTLVQGLTHVAGTPDNVPGFQLALATAASVYFFRENKKMKLAPAAGYTVAGLVVGALLGGALQSWLRVDIVPIGSFDSPSVLVSEFALLALWAVCTFLA